jgi:hypothetical protein
MFGFSCRRLATAGSESLGRWELLPPHPRFPLCSAFLASGSHPRATRLCRRGLPPPHPRFTLRSAFLAGGSVSRAATRLVCGSCRSRTPAFRCVRLLSCRRLATAGSEALGTLGLPLPRFRFPLRSACLASGRVGRGWEKKSEKIQTKNNKHIHTAPTSTAQMNSSCMYISGTFSSLLSRRALFSTASASAAFLVRLRRLL